MLANNFCFCNLNDPKCIKMKIPLEMVLFGYVEFARRVDESRPGSGCSLQFLLGLPNTSCTHVQF